MKKDVVKDVDEAMVKHTTSLARLEIPAKEIETYQRHLAKVLHFIDRLKEVKTPKNVLPLVNPIEKGNQGRADVICPSLPPKDILANASECKLNHYKVEAVLEE